MGTCGSAPAPAPAPARPQGGAPAPAAASAEQAAAGKQQLEEQISAKMPAEIFMLSGCQDCQTSADVSNVASFRLPEASGPGGAGGACTSALLEQAYKRGDASWVKLLVDMRDFLKDKGYKQVPQLSTSRPTALDGPFDIDGQQAGRHLALMIGINYVGHEQGRLSGCVNDVLRMKEYIKEFGFQENAEDMRILIDDDDQGRVQVPTQAPTKANIEAGIRWLVETAQPGDAIFIHYSGHGTQVTDTSGDEKDGKDEALCPTDYNQAGFIIDDWIMDNFVARLPAGVRCFALMDCCHSGSVFDLPYSCLADEKLDARSGGLSTVLNSGFVKYLAPLALSALSSLFS